MFQVPPVVHVAALELDCLRLRPDSEDEVKQWVGMGRVESFRNLSGIASTSNDTPVVLEVLLQKAMHGIGLRLELYTEHIGPDGFNRVVTQLETHRAGSFGLRYRCKGFLAPLHGLSEILLVGATSRADHHPGNSEL